ncbi:MAG: cytochrome-c oxidase, cbb3-type subunit III [Chromatiales bacterium]|nr:cytochrome-c oxidase, cbb3-type subunit III [Chromatiales bacterium]
MSDKNNPYSAPDTGHVWDDSLRELLNQPPQWWMIGFYASMLLVVVYWIIYPAIPLATTHTKGIKGWTAVGEYREDMAAIQEVRAEYEGKIEALATNNGNNTSATAAAIMQDDSLSEYVVRSGKVLFGDNCAACHGTEGSGNQGFPVLNDDDWLYGGTIQNIAQSITIGRTGSMPSHTMSDEELSKLTSAILAGTPSNEPLFSEKGCFACHGADGKGMHALGAANLTDGIWRFVAADQAESVKHTITHGVNMPGNPQSRNAVMPKFGGGKLTNTEIAKLSVYVHKLGGGQ